MKDFAGYEAAETAASRTGSAPAAEQGYKRFRRRRQQILADAPQLHAASEAAAVEVSLPAPLPEPWEQFRRVPIGARQLKQAGFPLVNFFREDPAAKAFDLLRTRLLHTLRARGWKRVAVAAPLSGCGATFTAVNLALSLARVPDSRTVLMDMNRRAPGVAKALNMRPAETSADFLQGDLRMEDYLIRPSDTLALGLAGGSDGEPDEIIHSPSCGAVLEDMLLRSGADTVIYDLPPVLEYDDLAAFLPQVDGVLLVSDGTRNTAAQLQACEKILAGHCELLGVVLNRARHSGGAAFGG